MKQKHFDNKVQDQFCETYFHRKNVFLCIFLKIDEIQNFIIFPWYVSSNQNETEVLLKVFIFEVVILEKKLSQLYVSVFIGACVLLGDW